MHLPKLFFRSSKSFQKKQDRHLRIVSFNVHFGNKPEKISQAILVNKNLNQADIILLQEIEEHAGEVQSRAAAIAQHLGMDHIYVPARHHQYYSHGLAILTKLPFTEATTTLQLYKFEFPFRARPRIAVKAKVVMQHLPVFIYNVHLDTRLNFRERVHQLEKVMKDIEQNPDARIILAGDLNTLPIHWANNTLPIFYSNQKKKMYKFLTKQKFASLPLKLGATMDMRHSLLRFQLDAIYARGFTIKNYGVEKTVRVSDHFPVWADLELI